MEEMIKKQLARIETMDSVSLAEYRENRIKYSIGDVQKILVDACDKRLKALDRSNAIVEDGDLSDLDVGGGILHTGYTR